MQVTFPHMGTFSIGLKALFSGLGLKVIVPPPVTEKTIRLGIQHSPEFACFPLKINMGNFIESLELGADTIVMAGGVGPCRFGYYAQVEQEILRDLGYDFKMIVIEPPQKGIKELGKRLAPLKNGKSWQEVAAAIFLCWSKLKALDELHKEALASRWFEIRKGLISDIYRQSIEKIDLAACRREVKKALADGVGEMKAAAGNSAEQSDPLQILLVGEIYMLLEPYANLDIEKILGEYGVRVKRSIYLSDWVKEHVILNNLGIRLKGAYKKAAAPYLNHFVGGHGWESVGDTVLAAQKGIDGVIHVLPFTCTPEIVARSILPNVSRDNSIPVMSFSLDEHSARAGFITRLEAFVDLLSKRKSTNKPKGEGIKAAFF